MWELTNKEFTGLMQQYQKLIYTVCLQFVHEPHTAEDLTQDTFLSAFSAIDRCEPQYYKQWLVRVAANKCKDHLKSAWVRKVDVPGDDALPEPRGAPGSDADDPAQSVADRAGAPSWKHWCAVCASPTAELPCCTFWSTGKRRRLLSWWAVRPRRSTASCGAQSCCFASRSPRGGRRNEPLF